MLITRNLVVAVLAVLVADVARAQTATFTSLNQAASANDLTPDGTIVVGTSTSGGGYYWTHEDGYTLIGGLEARAVSDDGSVIFGQITDVDSGFSVAAVWTAGDGWESIGSLPGGLPCPSISSAYELSADGTVGVGLGWADGCQAYGIRWTPDDGMQPLELLANGSNRASVVSADGQVIGGFAQGSFSRTPAVWHADGSGELLDPPNGDVLGEVHGISDDGTLLLGEWDGQAFILEVDFGIELFGPLIPNYISAALDISDNGIVVGFDRLQLSPTAWIRPPGGSITQLRTYLLDQGAGGVPLLDVAQAISTDGTVIIGHNAFQGGWIATLPVIEPECQGTADCADLDDNGIRDDNCVWWQCVDSACQATDIAFADMGGEFGACPADGAVDGNDRFHALNCFANSNTQGGVPYPCEDAPPSAYNVDAGGEFGSCQPDGVCDGNDAFAALNAFNGSATCSCPSGGPTPEFAGQPVVVDRTALRLQPSARRAAPGDTIAIDVFLDDAVSDLRGYQLHLAVSGGHRGNMKLLDIQVLDRQDWIYSGLDAWQAFNATTGQMVVGLDHPGIAAPAGTYLATFTYRVSKRAAGDFLVAVLHDDHDPSQRTFLFPTPANGKIAIQSADADLIRVE